MAGKKHAAPVRRPAPVHAMIERPIFLRKTILSTAIDATRLLKNLEEFRILKLQKAKAHRQLNRVMRELRGEQKRLEQDHLPTIPHDAFRPQHAEDKTKHAPAHVQQRPSLKKSAPRNELDRLNTELHDIEERLKHL